MNKKEINEKIEEGHIHFNTIIEMVGKPKEHVDKTIKEYVKSIDENNHYILTKKDISKSKKTDDGFFTSFAEVEVLAEDIHGIFAFCFNYMPASIEILEPDQIILDNVGFTDVANELQAKLHQVDMVAKQANQKNVNGEKNLSAMLANFVIFACRTGPKTLEEMSKITGLKAEALAPFLEGFVKAEKLKKEEDKYSL